MKQKRKMGRKLLIFLLTLAMVVGLMPGMSLTTLADDTPSVAVSPAEGGRVIVERSATDPNNWDLTAVPNEGYDLSGWYEWGGTVSNNANRYKLDNMTDNDVQNIECRFVPAYTVTYKVVGGTWSDGTTADKTETVMQYHRPENVPTGMVAATGYTGEGSWDLDPLDRNTPSIREDTTFTYIFDEKPSISETVTFKVTNGSWDDGTTADKTITVKCYEGDTLKLSAEQIPAVGTKPNEGYKAGNWDVTPSADTVISKATTYTYTYEVKEEETTSDTPATDTSINTEVKTAEGAPAIKADNLDNALAQKLLTDAEKAEYANGTPVLVYLDVKEVDKANVPADDVKAIDKVTSESGYTYGDCLDISLWKKMGDGDATQVHDTNGNPIKMTVTVPASLAAPAGFVRTIRVVRVHGGEAKVLAEGTGLTLDFSSDGFSSYFLVYKDTKIEEAINTSVDTSSNTQSTPAPAQTTATEVPKTGEYMPIAALIMLILSMTGMVMVITGLKKKNHI